MGAGQKSKRSGAVTGWLHRCAQPRNGAVFLMMHAAGFRGGDVLGAALLRHLGNISRMFKVRPLPLPLSQPLRNRLRQPQALRSRFFAEMKICRTGRSRGRKGQRFDGPPPSCTCRCASNSAWVAPLALKRSKSASRRLLTASAYASPSAWLRRFRRLVTVRGRFCMMLFSCACERMCAREFSGLGLAWHLPGGCRARRAGLSTRPLSFFWLGIAREREPGGYRAPSAGLLNRPPFADLNSAQEGDFFRE
ncbi:hypothetical protein ebA196 [Aromatoleum aromaticum EbN1]|uniref:Uncharacterized protein n=1 Tax=Aromatoleum aromaticum (strain DSM 19018 / LMG 30748 / EbN1) TaxID=76114 RepID=Q5P8X5_AROAE|nr:hypothetical protein ebA196 [Aromatoleum aromaticum EbN1]